MALCMLGVDSDEEAGAAPVFAAEQEALLRLVEDDRPSLSLHAEIVRVSEAESIVAVRFSTLTDGQYRMIERLVLGRRDSARRATR